MATLMVASIGLALLAGWTYNRLVVRPISRLVARIEDFRAGRGQALPPIRAAQELRQLDQALGAMIEALDRRALSAQDQTDQLERAVRTRTNELERVLTQVERSEAARRQMMADVSHELRTPLTIIQGEADVSLRGAPKDAEAYRYSLTRIRETSRHANHVVDDLLLIARQESGALRLDLRDVDLCAILRETAALSPRPVMLEMAVPQAPTKADPMRLRQCLLALFQNAARYGGSAIWARVAAVPGGFALSVEDDGPGMSDAEKAQAFERFFRGSNAAQPEIAGTGLGLPIVRAIVRAHDGSVTLADRAGGGLAVTMVLPTERPIGLVWDADRAPARRRPGATD